jgi:predicted PurR-regulated permease PerM
LRQKKAQGWSRGFCGWGNEEKRMNESSGNPRSLRSDIVFAFTLALACALAWLVRDVLMLLYVSALFAVVLTPVVRSTSGLRIGRWQPFKGSAILFLLLAVAAALTAFGFAYPTFWRSSRSFPLPTS